MSIYQKEDNTIYDAEARNAAQVANDWFRSIGGDPDVTLRPGISYTFVGTALCGFEHNAETGDTGDIKAVGSFTHVIAQQSTSVPKVLAAGLMSR